VERLLAGHHPGGESQEAFRALKEKIKRKKTRNKVNLK